MTDHIIETEYLRFFHGFSTIDTDIVSDLSDELINKFDQLKKGEYLNNTEKRQITHHHLRSSNTIENVETELINFTKEITNKPFNTVCHIGIGGSVTGPRFIDHLLTTWDQKKLRQTQFISNHDEDHIDNRLPNNNIENVMFVIVSKSGSTIEIKKILDYIISKYALDEDYFLKKQCIFVTSNQTKFNTDRCLKTFYFDEGVGGRFSTTSVVSLVSLSLTFGTDIIRPFLTGAQLADQNASIRSKENISLLMAIIRYKQLQDYPGLAIIPYGEALIELVPLLSQLTCESLGKGANNKNKLSNQQFSPILMTGVGPNAQHTFFQQIHQGHPIIPIDFYAITPKRQNQIHQLKQLVGQSISLHKGQHSENPHQYFSGKRASTITIITQHNIEAIGFFIASLENKIMFEGFLSDINCFDQPGVELGKATTNNLDNNDENGQALFQSLIKPVGVKK